MDNNHKTIFFGLTSFRNQKKKFGIKTDDRRKHFYTIGKTGMGKSNLMENMAIQDIQAGYGIAYVDPHGEGAEKLLDFVPENRIKDVIYLNPSDLDYPIAFNVMEKVDFRFRHLVANGLMGVFKKVWPDVWSARMEYILNNCILALLEYPDSTLLGINRMLADVKYREEVVSKVKDPIVKSFWVTEYARYTQRYEIEATAAIQNKVGQFVSNALIRNVIGQTNSTINMRKIMDEQKILIIDLSKGKIGEDNSRLLGALLITKLQLAAMSRVDIPEEKRKDFYLYVDEFQNFATESFANILSEARKYRLCLIVGHQYISQMEETVRDAVFGNVGTLAVFRVGAEDAEFLEKEFSPEFTADDLCNLAKYNIYLKLMIDGIASHPFSAQTLAPSIPLEKSNKMEIINASRERYSIERKIVEEKIISWTYSDQGDKKNDSFHNIVKKEDQKQENKYPLRQAFDNQTILYNATCTNCNKSTKTIFQPTEGKPVYCKSCLKKVNNKNQEKELSKKLVIDSTDSDIDNDFKLENISFNSSSEKINPSLSVPPRRDGVGAIRKEINLSELKKALEESLDKKEKSSYEEKSEKNNEKKDENKKGVINPGQKIKF